MDKNFEYKKGVSIQKEKGEGNLLIFKISQNGEQVGEAYLDYFPGDDVYYIASFNVFENFRGNKYGSNLLESICAFLRHENKNGLLENTIKDEKMKDFYLDHGWVPLVDIYGTSIKDFLIYKVK